MIRCPYCNSLFTPNLNQIYCCTTHKTYAYRQRRQQRSPVPICEKCGKPWKEGKPLTKGKSPQYCAACQDYYADHYKTKKASELVAHQLC